MLKRKTMTPSSFRAISFVPLWAALLWTAAGCGPAGMDGERAEEVGLEAHFRQPPDSVKPWMYWYWISDNISRKGITRDLETMARLGIGEAFIGNIGLPEVPYGRVPVLGQAWWGLTKHAFHEAARTGVHLGMFNSPGWSQSGGPWVKPGQAMRHLVRGEWVVKGPLDLRRKLAVPWTDFQDVALLAFPAPEDDGACLGTGARLQSDPRIPGLDQAFDGDTATVALLPASSSLSISWAARGAFTARSLAVWPSRHPVAARAELQAYRNGTWVSLRRFEINRSNPALHVGPEPFAPVVVAFPATTAERFRLLLSGFGPGTGLAEICLSSAARLERYPEKQLAKMHQTPHPLWGAYQWPRQAEPGDSALVVAPSTVQQLGDSLAADGTLHWQVPPGRWVIQRIGMVPTGVTNAPAPPEATGPEVDKMSSEALKAHFEAFIGRILDSLPDNDRKTFRHVVADSYETGSENWTDGFAGAFKQRYHYDPLPWLPVLSGRLVGSAEASDRFLWDLRRLVADKIAYAYVGGLRQLSEAHGLRVWLENYGHWGFPSEFLLYGGQSDDIAGEFWTEGDLGTIELRDAASAAHIYGKRQVFAESFTAGGQAFKRYPGLLKKRGDWSFTEGVNHTLLHVYIEQAYDSMPGVNAGFGTEFNRQNTWFPHAKPWIDYLRRCMFMLQRGRPVADVCYFIGEGAPSMTGTREPALPKGYDFDYINADVIEHRLQVRDGRLVLPGGASYRLMVLPPLKTMRPELLRKISALVAEGATILGEPPERSPSLEGYPRCDEVVRRLADSLWQQADGKQVRAVRFGRGTVLRGMDLDAALARQGLRPDLQLPEGSPLLYVHRQMADADIYFLSNQSDSMVSVTAAFRVQGRQPELWDAVSGSIRPLPAYRQDSGRTYVPLRFAPAQSWFVVFRRPSAGASPSGENFPEGRVLQVLGGPWSVRFDSAMRGPAAPVLMDSLTDWSRSPLDSIRYYSGAAVYRKTFRAARPEPGERVVLELGRVGVLAELRLNGHELGGLWTPPWQVDVTDALRQGDNTLEIRVVNLWVNRLIGDSRLPPADRPTWSAVAPYHPEDPLEPSGLLGPVLLRAFDQPPQHAAR